MNDLYSLEIDKLDEMLTQEGIEHSTGKLHDGYYIRVPNDDKWLWDAVCHSFSYGHDRGLLEIMGDCLLTNEERKWDSVQGYLTAEDVMERVHNIGKKEDSNDGLMRIGDEVAFHYNDGRPDTVVVITHIGQDGFIDGMDAKGTLYASKNPQKWTKTGRYFPLVEQLLREMEVEE